MGTVADDETNVLISENWSSTNHRRSSRNSRPPSIGRHLNHTLLLALIIAVDVVFGICAVFTVVFFKGGQTVSQRRHLSSRPALTHLHCCASRELPSPTSVRPHHLSPLYSGATQDMIRKLAKTSLDGRAVPCRRAGLRRKNCQLFARAVGGDGFRRPGDQKRSPRRESMSTPTATHSSRDSAHETYSCP
jgi:hypothetical protein